MCTAVYYFYEILEECKEEKFSSLVRKPKSNQCSEHLILLLFLVLTKLWIIQLK